jgi:2'-5' RNA ligase
MARLFIGTFLELSDQQRLAKLHELNSELGGLSSMLNIRWTKSSKLHMTWLFLGEVEKNRIQYIEKMLRHVLTAQKLKAKLEVVFDTIKIWPGQHNPRYAVLVPETVIPEIQSLQQLIKTELAQDVQAGHREIKKRFKPHITLMRLETKNSQPLHSKGLKINSLENILPIILSIKNICLVESKLGDAKEEYRILSTCSL